MKPNAPKNLSLKLFLKNFATEVFHIDSRITRTLITLITAPGHLTTAYFKSSDEKYIQPLKLYFIINFIFFFATPILSTSNFQIFSFSLKSLSSRNHIYQNIIRKQIQANNVSEEIYEERFNAHLKYNQPAFVFLIIPLFAFILNIINFRNKRYYLEHLIFALHFLSFFLLSLLIIISSYRILMFVLKYFSVSNGFVAIIILPSLLIWLSIYLFVASGTFYKNRILSNILKFPFILAGFFIALGIYTQFLFFYTIIALKWGY